MNPEIWISLLTLTFLEIVLGIDNIIFISILTGKLPASQQRQARQWGLSLAMITRILLLLSLSWIMRLTDPLFYIMDHPMSGKTLILLLGGLFLIYKSTHEIHQKLEGDEGESNTKIRTSLSATILQILILDLVFSLDSVITAVGMANQVPVMVAAVIIAVIVMMIAAKSISDFVDKHPTIKILALSFLVMIGLSLIAESFEQHVPKGYIYFSMGFSVAVEMLNLRMKKSTTKPVKLKEPYTK